MSVKYTGVVLYRVQASWMFRQVGFSYIQHHIPTHPLPQPAHLSQVDISRLPAKTRTQLAAAADKANSGASIVDNVPLSARFFAGHIFPRPIPPPLPQVPTKPYTGRSPAAAAAATQPAGFVGTSAPPMAGQQWQHHLQQQQQAYSVHQSQYMGQMTGQYPPHHYGQDQLYSGGQYSGGQQYGMGPGGNTWTTPGAGVGRPLGEAVEQLPSNTPKAQLSSVQQQRDWAQWQQQLASGQPPPPPPLQQPPLSWVEQQSAQWQQQQMQRQLQMTVEQLQQGGQPQQQQQQQELPYLQQQRDMQLQQYIKEADQSHRLPEQQRSTVPHAYSGSTAPSMTWVEEQSLLWQAQQPQQYQDPSAVTQQKQGYIVQHQPVGVMQPPSHQAVGAGVPPGHQSQAQGYGNALQQQPPGNGYPNYQFMSPGIKPPVKEPLIIQQQQQLQASSIDSEVWAGIPLWQRPPFPPPVAQPEKGEEWHAGDDDPPEFTHEEVLEHVVRVRGRGGEPIRLGHCEQLAAGV